MCQFIAFDNSTWVRKAGSYFINAASRNNITDLNGYGEILLGKTSISFLDNQLSSSSMLLSRWKHRF